MEDESIHIVMEYAEKGDLYKVSFAKELGNINFPLQSLISLMFS